MAILTRPQIVGFSCEFSLGVDDVMLKIGPLPVPLLSVELGTISESVIGGNAPCDSQY